MGSVMNSKDFAAARKVKAANLTELGVVPVCIAPGDEIFSHSHTLIQEVIIVHSGKGKVQIEDKLEKVCAGSVAVIPAGCFHALCNTGKQNLEATVVYNSNVNREQVDFKNREQHFGTAQAEADVLRAELKTLKKAFKKLKKKAR